MRLISRHTLAVAVIAVAVTACGPKGQAAQGKATVGNVAQADEPSPEAAKAATAATNFMTNNAKQPGVVTTASGLQYKIVKSGPADGDKPGLRDEVKVNYEGTLIDGTVFDSTTRTGQPAVFGVSEVVPGWTEVLQLMRPGDEWIVYLPPKLGYGDRGGGPIPPGSVLVFHMQLLGVLKAGPANA